MSSKNRIIYKGITDFKDIKEIIYYCAERYNEKTAFVIKHFDENNEKEFYYENVSYKRFLDDINKLGTAFY